VLIFWLSVTSFGVCLASGFFPLINAEVYLLAASLASPREATVPLLVAGTLGQMAAKVIMYYGAQGVIRLPAHRYAGKINQWADQLDRWKGHTGAMVFVSALVGLPPFFVVSILCGMIRFSISQFLVFGTAGRLLRFSVFVLFPELVRDWLP